jgi:hypothetical protein
VSIADSVKEPNLEQRGRFNLGKKLMRFIIEFQNPPQNRILEQVTIAIKDEFTDLPISSQRKFQLRMKRDKRCPLCGEPAIMGVHCLKHLVQQRERQRRKLGLRRRFSTLGYRLEAEARALAEEAEQAARAKASRTVTGPVTEQEFRVVYPQLLGRIRQTLFQHASEARPVASLGFIRLPYYFDSMTLACAKVVFVPRVPVPSLSAMGLARLGAFERMRLAGMTFFHTYFVRADRAQEESLHFHELVHVIQWRLLGGEKFLAFYTADLERFGYRRSPLERMAFDLQKRFERADQHFSVEATCQKLVAEGRHRPERGAGTPHAQL